MIYAPVVIPTLNRFEHLRRCIDSLEKCKGAIYTDVYIALDYPPSKKYEDGWRKNDSYLHEKEQSHGFRSFTVVRREENYFFSGKGNSRSLQKELFKMYDRAILSEDDNVFSPNFLEYINKGLEKFKDDPAVYSICGYGFFYNLRYGANNFIRQNTDYNAWGYGVWRDKHERLHSLNVNYLRKIIYNPFRVAKIWRVSNMRMNNLIHLSQKKYFKRGDNFMTLYMINEGMHQIMPKVSKVRNIGWDGTGLHCNNFDHSIENKHLNQKTDSEIEFNYIGTGWEYYQENHKIMVKEDIHQISTIKVLVKYILRLMKVWA